MTYNLCQNANFNNGGTTIQKGILHVLLIILPISTMAQMANFFISVTNLNSKFRIPNSEFRILNSEFRILNSEFLINLIDAFIYYIIHLCEKPDRVSTSYPQEDCWLVGFCCFTSQVNIYGHCGTVSSPNHTFSWADLNKRLTSNLCTYFRL